MPKIEAQLLRIIRLHVELASFRMDPNDELKDHVIKVNEKIQEFICKGCRSLIESDEERYNMLLVTFPIPNLKGLLTLIWKTIPERRHNKRYKALVTKFKKEYPKWGAKRTATLSISSSLRS